MVSMARGLMADPNMVNNARYGYAEKTRPCIRCNNCIQKTHYMLAPIRCAVNAEMGKETLYAYIQAPSSAKKVAVIGGGPGGMEAARTAAERGYQVILFEKTDKLGGVLNMAAIPEFKKDLKAYLDWAVRETEIVPNIEIRKNTEATPAMIAEEKFDAVIVAVGSNPIIPSFVQASSQVVWVGDVETGKAEAGQNVVIVGAGLTGCEAALAQRRKGKNVTLVDRIPEENFGQGGAKFNQIAIINMMKNEGITFIGGMHLDAIGDKGAVFINKDNKEELLPCDTVVLSLGVCSDKSYVDDFQGCAADVVAIGDCNTNQGTLYNAVHTGHEAGYLI